MVVKVCDALCGAGKTQGCIDMINRDTDHKFVFITPYLDEVERIKRSCAERKFVSPERTFKNGYSKLNDLHCLLRAGVNIASTHALFAMATEETKELIRANNYILVLDEVIDLYQPTTTDGGDVDFLVRNNIVQKVGDDVVWGDEEYSGVAFSELRQMSVSKRLISYDGRFFFWALPPDVFQCFKDAYVLTYLFEYQFLKYYFDLYDIPYELIGTHKVGDAYQFCSIEEMDRRRDLQSKIHIVEDDKYNGIGKGTFDLSSGWFERESSKPNKPKLATLKKCIYNIFRNTKAHNDDKMWTTLNKYRNELRGKGYSSCFITFNKRATNEFANRHYLAYCVNVFMMPWMKNYLEYEGSEKQKALGRGSIKVNQDMYALSVLIQWIFRSAVRKGEEVWIYLPSKRMRYLLTEWLKNLNIGKDLKSIKYVAKKEKRIGEMYYEEKIKIKNERKMKHENL